MHEDELKSKEASQVDILPWAREVLRERGLSVPEEVGLSDLLDEDPCNSQHGPSSMDELGLLVPDRSSSKYIIQNIGCEDNI